MATAKTISDAGTTLGIAFTTDGKEDLTLKAGLIYYLSVTEDGKMTVVAKEKGVADGNYYLVGNFFEEDGDNINYDKKFSVLPIVKVTELSHLTSLLLLK